MALEKTPEHVWLNEVGSVPVQRALRHPQTAFANFFAKRAKYPNFRYKDGAQSAEYTTRTFKWDGESLKPHTPLAIRWSRTLPKGAKVTTAECRKTYRAGAASSMLCDDVVCAKLGISSKVDIGLRPTHFAILSKREKNTGPKTLRKNVAKLAKL